MNRIQKALALLREAQKLLDAEAKDLKREYIENGGPGKPSMIVGEDADLIADLIESLEKIKGEMAP